MSDNSILAKVYDAVDQINNQNEGSIIEKSPKTVLFGNGGCLDSLGLVNLVITIEQNIEDDCGVKIIIADERAMSQKYSPFRTLGSLVDYIEMLLEEELNDW